MAWRSGPALHAASLDPTQGFVARPVISGAVGKPVLSGNLLVFELAGQIESFDLATGRRILLRREQARGAARPVGQRLPPQLHQGDLQAPAGAHGRASSRAGSRATAPSTARRRRRDATPVTKRGRFPAKGHINQPLWVRPPAGVHDTLTTTASTETAIYVTRVRQPRGATATSALLRIDLEA